MLQIDADRLWNRLQELGQIGRKDGGALTRLAYTEDLRKAQDKVRGWMEEAGLRVREDAAGNLIGEYGPGDSAEAPVAAGSHLDTVRNAGIFDGSLGVLAAVEAVQTLREAGIVPLRPIRVTAYQDEEGNRFGSGMLGSRAVTGKTRPEDLQMKDASGVTLREAMEAWGCRPDALESCRQPRIHSHLELHIEQGRVLERAGCSVGIVEGIPCLYAYDIIIRGTSGHAGATPMPDRLDPVQAMCRWILAIQEIVRRRPGMVATTGVIETSPGSVNVICDHVHFTLDIRALELEKIEACLEELRPLEEELEAEGFVIEKKPREELQGMLCDPRMKEELEEIMKENDMPYLRLMSGAGHDSQNFAGICPCAMIFVRSRNGYSHRPDEYSSREDCAAGARILLEMLARESGAQPA